MNLAQAYRAERAPFVGHGRVRQERAATALRSARVRVAWEAAGGTEVDEWEAGRFEAPDVGHVRLMLVADSDSDPTDGLEAPERVIQAERERARSEGVCGVKAQYWDGANWEDVDSVWGFIGQDWKASGYDVDLMSAALDALSDHLAEQAQEIEAARSDLYSTQH